ncbi:MAG: histidine kinase [Bacteroidetes bacterium HGW-Bacteroidetes-17]|jgi:nitrogen fixation/metabolism regulation signal transduction histidine kinase|nr:MAG: histidine kinase [Bacteroidetes bacterium HGW-Bacteroidetes-17]
MSIKWKFILCGLFLYLSTGFILLQLLEVNKWYFVIGEFLLLISIILFVVLYHQLVKPIDTIRLAINLLKEKDFSTRLSPVHQKEIDQLIEVYNKMAEQLHHERVEHEEKNLFLGLLIDASTSAILVLDGENKIRKLNPAAFKLFNLKEDTVLPISFSHLSHPWFSKLSELKVGESIAIRIDGIRQFKASCSSFMDKGFTRPFILIEEMTCELIRAERQSYERVIRMMSHEVNNSVGAVNSVLQSVQSLSTQFDENMREDITNAITVSMDRNKSLTQFMANFADVVKLPQPEIKQIDLSVVISKTLHLFKTEFANRHIILERDLKRCLIKADTVQMEQMMMNIIKNSMEAIVAEGTISVQILNKPLSLSIIDTGQGFSDEIIEKLFTPFFSTKKTGQGIGLTLVREILLNHGFNFKLHRIENNRTEFLIELE